MPLGVVTILCMEHLSRLGYHSDFYLNWNVKTHAGENIHQYLVEVGKVSLPANRKQLTMPDKFGHLKASISQYILQVLLPK